MRRLFKIHTACFCLLLLGLVGARSARARALPDAFELFFTAPGVLVYGNEEVEEAYEYVQILDLSAGARLEFWYGDLTPAPRGGGLFGGASPTFKRHYLPDVWLSLAAEEPDMLCLVNGQFFRDTVDGMWVDPTELAFPLKHDGVIVSEGYERRRFRSNRAMLQLWSDHAAIDSLNRQALYNSTAPNIIAGLDEEARIRPGEKLGRTMIGVGDGDGDGRHERLFIYSGAAATQRHAMATLRAFGAQQIMILDGGGSAQLSCAGYSYIRRIRPLPQMIATIPASSAQPAGLERQAVADPHLTMFEKMLARWLQILQPRQE